MACLNENRVFLSFFLLFLFVYFVFRHYPNLNETKLIHTRAVVINVKEKRKHGMTHLAQWDILPVNFSWYKTLTQEIIIFDLKGHHNAQKRLF